MKHSTHTLPTSPSLSPPSPPFPGVELTVRTLIPSFLALAGARLAVHALFGRSQAARIKRVRRNAFIRAFFEHNRIEAKID